MDSQSDQVQLLENIASSLHELVILLHIISHPIIKEVLEKTLNSHEKKLVYDLMDGEKTVASIQERSGVNVRFISEWGQEWEKLGIVETISTGNVRGRRRKMFNLSIYDIQIKENDIN